MDSPATMSERVEERSPGHSPDVSTVAEDYASKDDSVPAEDMETSASLDKNDTDPLQDVEGNEDSHSVSSAKDAGKDRDESMEGLEAEKSGELVIETSPTRIQDRTGGLQFGTPDRPGNLDSGSPEAEKSGDLGINASPTPTQERTGISQVGTPDRPGNLDSGSSSEAERSGDLVINISPTPTQEKTGGSQVGTPDRPGNLEGGSSEAGGEGGPRGGSPVPDQAAEREQIKDRLLQDPVDHEVEAGDLEITDSLQTGEVQNRSGRIIKKRETYSPEHDHYKKKKLGRTSSKFKIRRSNSFSDTADVSPSSSGFQGSSPNVKLKKRADVKPQWLKPFAEGWRREIVLRNTYDEDKKRAADVYYYPPNKGKLRSSVQIGKYLDEIGNFTLTTECFTFIKETIYEEPAEYVRVAGRTSIGRPKGSPSKSPKTPIMKHKKNPFAKSPLLLKKTALGLTASPTSSKASPILIKMLPKVASPSSSTVDVKPKFIIVNKQAGESPSTSTVRTVGSISVVKTPGGSAVTTTTSPATQFIRVIPSSGASLVKKPVAKKHTGKRSMQANDDNPASKKIKVVVPMSDSENQRLCDMNCPGRHGVPPSLHCTVCMCMFHPECVNRGLHHQRLDGFICRTCRAVQKKMNNTKSVNNNNTGGSQGNLSSLTCQAAPPPLQSVRASLPPPLKVGPVTISTMSQRQPPPLRMAPGTGPAPIMPPMAPPPLRAAGHPPVMRTMVPDPSSIPLPVLNQSPATVIAPPTNGSLPDALPSMVPRPMGSSAIQVSLPSSTPKDISGQILALPTNVTSKLNMDKPVALKVNGQRYLIPPHCFINTQEGAKIYLPPGYLPSSVVQGPSSPLSVNLNPQPGKDEQLLNITPLGDMRQKLSETGCESGSTSPIEGEKAQNKQTRPNRKIATPKNYCHIQQLHLGFDCMLHIFRYLGLKDLLTSRAVCKTWKRVASQHWMWKKIQLRGHRVTDWEQAAEFFRDLHTHTLDLRGLQHGEDLNRTWHQFTGILPNLMYLRRIDFGQCPSTVLHAVTEKLPGLTALTAEFITDTTQEQQMWSSNAKLDIGKFCGLKDLEVLKLRGLCGLTMPAFSFSGGLSELSSLTKLRMLSLTTLRDVSEDEFHFLSSLVNLEELELGDLSSWKPETYDQLSSLTNLTSLRLECGVDYNEGGLGDALPNLSRLKNLELIKFAMSGSLMKSLVKVESIETLSIWPDTEYQPALVNTCTLRAVIEMSSLKQLDWGIMIDTSAPASTPATSNNPDDASQDSNSSSSSGGGTASSKQAADGVPILSSSVDVLVSPSKLAQLSTEENVEHLTINQLVDRLCNHLPDTKIRVFKVPIVTPKAAASKQT